jgi:uncharacterized protein YdhG (YjbR/CyaY superfamily)
VPGFKSVEEYIDSQPEAVQDVLDRVRSTIRRAVPGAEELISYQIATYKPLNDDLGPYKVNKGTIRFPLSRTREV